MATHNRKTYTAGMRKAMLELVKVVGKNKHGAILGLFVCDCGNTKEIAVGNVFVGSVKSCGCYNRSGDSSVRHGHNRGKPSLTYSSWYAMKARCKGQSKLSKKNYKDRGIVVCERWHSFDNFLSDMGLRPSIGHSIDRIDNDGSYELGNCKWATKKEQDRNKRSTRLLAAYGFSMIAPDWAEVLEIPVGRIRSRLQYGWSDHDALFLPFAPGVHLKNRKQ